MIFCAVQAYGQDTQPKTDSTRSPFPYKDSKTPRLTPEKGLILPPPSNVQRSVDFDPITRRYIIREKIGDMFYRQPLYLSIEEYQKYENEQIKRAYWKQLSDKPVAEAREPGFIPQVTINSRSFDRIFGGSTIDIRPQGSADLTFSGKLNKNENPLFNEHQRFQGNFDFDQRIQMNLVGQIGDKLRISTNYNTEAQFDFENQVKVDYTGKEDEIIKKIEAGNVNLPLNSTLISGSQALFGLKTQLQFGRMNVTSVFSQQKSQQKEITITNGSQQNEFRISADNYEANKHFFLAQYFRQNYNRAMANIPIITSQVNITRIEVWVTNRSGSTTDSRDILAFMDLGENQPYNTALIQGGPGFSSYPAGFSGPGFEQQSNTLLQNLPAGVRLTNSNDVISYFQGSGGTDHYSKLTYARKLTDKEFTVHPQLGYISLNSALNTDEVLAVAYRYTVNGVEYQVGEFASDVPVNAAAPTVLYVKLLKNETIKTNLPTWDLMMKNIYSLGAYQVSRSDFRLNIFRLDESTGVEKPQITEGRQTSGKLWLQVTNVDNLNQSNDRRPDGFFDFVEGVTIDPVNGRITFPLVEPFGSDLRAQFDPVTESALIDKYVFQPLYDSTKVVAQQYFPKQNRYVIRGTYQSQTSSEFQLNAINIPPGSVQVVAGTLPLQEGADFTVDYNIGRVRILNQALLNSGQPIRIKLENNELFGLQQRSLFGTRFDYHLNNKVNLGGTLMRLTEKPLTQKVNIGEEAIANTIWGMDLNYNSDSRWLTRMVDKLPFIATKEPSSITFSGEFAHLIPGHPNALNFAGGRNGTSYLDDFEASRSVVDIKSPISWQISGTPQMFPESELTNDLAYGYNRALLSFYTIDPIFFPSRSNSSTPSNIRNDRNQLSNHYAREVFEKEVFPFKESATGLPLTLPTLDLAYYPNVRGPYNFTTSGVNPDGTLANPRSRWGGMFRRLESNDFEALNIEFIEFWMLDPFIYKPNSSGGDLYFNLGNISEDILKDGRKSLENGLPSDSDPSKFDVTNWGRVPKTQPVTQAFDNNPDVRRLQDVGLDGLSDENERTHFGEFIARARAQLTPSAVAELERDPASDNFVYYRGTQLDQAGAGILQRYKRYNGTEGNSRTPQQSLEEVGVENSAATSLPDGEDINRDNNSTKADEYFQYRVSIRPQDLAVVGRNYITDIVPATVKLPNGRSETVRWIQFKVPISDIQARVGGIQDFKSIRFIRMFTTDFADTTIMRLAKLQLVRGEWRRFNAQNSPGSVIADPALINPGPDNSVLEVTTVNIEENGKRSPIPYVVPPGIERERDFSNFRGDTRQNEQSLALNVRNLRDGYGRAAFRSTFNDFRSYRRIEMFVHAEGEQLRDRDISAFLRIGTDNQDNYYEYEVPLKITNPGSRDPYAIWPDENRMDIEVRLFQEAKAARNNAQLNGQPWPVNVPFTYITGSNRITVLGQPDLSKVRVYMLGVRNPLRTAATSGQDDGLDKSAQVWFNELRLTEFDERGGWAGTARLNAKLADFADVTISGSKSTYGFGSIDRRVSERNRTDDKLFDISSSMELGKVFPERTGIKIPMFINVSSQVATPQYDPGTQDVELKTALKNAGKKERDSIRFNAEDFTTRRSINFTNVRKIKTDPNAKNHLWDIENWSGTYAYTEYNHRDFINANSIQKNYRAGLAYNFSQQPKSVTPFDKIIRSNMLALLRDFNFSLLPSVLNFRIDVDRLYSENSLRDNDPNNFIPVSTTFNKNFQMSRLYGISWNLTKSVQLDFNATNYAVIDEPEGRISGLARDTIWNNLRKLGRTTDYNHNLNITYNVPLNKIPGLDWITLAARYGSSFNWRGEPLLTLRDPDLDFGNSIQNSRVMQLNPNLSFSALYNKFGFIRRANDPNYDNAAGQFLVNLLTGIRTVSGAYTRTQGTTLPGYLPTTTILGQSLDANAPGWDFLFGSQGDIRPRAIANGWITRDSLQNQLYINSDRQDMRFRAVVEPVRDLQIELSAVKSSNFNYATNFKFVPSANSFESLSPVTSGDYSISFFSLRTAFKEHGGAAGLFRQFENNRSVISQRLGARNPNSGGIRDGFAEGYGENSQDVIIHSFLAAYTGRDAHTVRLNRFPAIPVPNWRITYNGLSKFRIFEEIFSSFDLNHSYNSTYNVNGFNSLVRYRENNGFVNVRDASGNFLPFYQFAQVSLFEQFVPLLGLDMRFRNSMTANLEYRKSRALSLSLSNSQLARQNDEAVTFGLGYRTNKFRFPFGLFSNLKMDNDMNFKLDVAVNDRKTEIYRSGADEPEVSAGARNISLRPSVDYVLNQRFNVRMFYDGSITQPYTSQTFYTSFSNFGVSLRFTLQ